MNGLFLRVLGLLSLVVLTIGLASSSLKHDDIFYHLHTGEQIFESLSIPKTDSFSHTRFGRPWTTHEWGFAALVYGAYRAAGYEGLIFLKILIALSILTTLFYMVKQETAKEHSVLIVPLLLLGIGVSAHTVILRAGLLTTLLLSLTLLFLRRFHSRGQKRFLVLIVATTWIWANCHAGVIFGLFVLALEAFDGVLGKLAKDRFPKFWALWPEKKPLPLVVVFFSSLIISIINPNGIEALLYPFRLNWTLYYSGIEYQRGIFAASSTTDFPWLWVLIAVLLTGLLPLSRLSPSMKKLKTVSVSQVLGTIFFW